MSLSKSTILGQKAKKELPFQAVPLSGAPGRDRIHNLLIRSQTLYPVELRAHMMYAV